MRSNFFAIIVFASLAFTGCESKSISTSDHSQPTYNSISGRVGVDGPILAVKVDDTHFARPQIGIDEADLVYIEQVEGGLTRLAAIFSSTIPEEIGPVRSARISDIDLLSQFGRVVFAYSGAQRSLWPVVASANLWDYGAQHSSPTIYPRDRNRTSPYNMIVRGDLLVAKSIGDSREIARSKSPGWSFGSAPVGGVPIDSSKIYWPASKYEVTWSKSANRWLLSNGGVADLVASGKQLSATTFVIQIVSITNSNYRGKDGTYTPFSQTIGTGTGYILRNGRSFKANWSRPSAEAGTTWTLADGSEIKFAPGSIWVALTDRKPEFTFTAPASPISK